MSDRPLRVLAPLGEDLRPLAALLLPLVSIRPIHVTLFHLGEGGILREAGRIFSAGGMDAKTRSGHGDPAEEIALFAKTGRFDLLAMITHGRRGLRRAFLGSVVEQTLRRTRVPLLVARPDTKIGPWRLVAAAVDGSAVSESVLPLAGRYAKAVGTPLHVVRAHAPGEGKKAGEELDVLCRRLERRGVVALPYLRKGAPAAQILRYAAEVGPGLICLTTHGHRGLKRWVLGSVAEEVVRRSPCPVLITHG